MTTSEFIIKATAKHSGLFTYTNTEYINSRTKVLITCKLHGDFLMTPNNHLNGQGCPVCGGTAKLTTASFITKATEVHGATYDYTPTVYKNMKTPIEAICKHHGLITLHPDAHIRGAGCNLCAEETNATAKRFTTEQFVQQASIRHQGRYMQSSTIYTGIHNKLTITCPIHGDFEQIANSHLRGNGCKHCADSAACYTEFPTLLYYVKIQLNGVTMYKIGITSKTVEQRFSRELAIGAAITTLFTKSFGTGRPAFLLEQLLLKNTKEHAYTGIPYLVNGIGDTELRITDIYTTIITLVEETKHLFTK